VASPSNPASSLLVLLFELACLLASSTIVSTIKVAVAAGPLVSILPCLLVTFRPVTQSDALGLLAWVVLSVLVALFSVTIWLITAYSQLFPVGRVRS